MSTHSKEFLAYLAQNNIRDIQPENTAVRRHAVLGEKEVYSGKDFIVHALLAKHEFTDQNGDYHSRFTPFIPELIAIRGAYPNLSWEKIQEGIDNMNDLSVTKTANQAFSSFSDDQKKEKQKIFKKRKKFLTSWFEPKSGEHIPENGLLLDEVLRKPIFNDEVLGKFIPEWKSLVQQESTLYNGKHLGSHIRHVIMVLQSLPEFELLTPKEQHLGLLAAVFHDIKKPLGKQIDIYHEIPSALYGAETMSSLGYDLSDITTVMKIIGADAIPTDMARGDHYRGKEMQQLPGELFEAMGKDERAKRILYVFNKADAITAVGEEQATKSVEEVMQKGFEKFSEQQTRYDRYFQEMR